MLEKQLNLLESVCRKFYKGKSIFDVILYGSLVRGKSRPRDIDIMIIFFNLELAKRVDIAQKLKVELRRTLETENVDVKQMNLVDFFDQNLLARQGVLVEGISLIDGVPISQKLGFNGYSIFTYKLSTMTHNEKTKFEYAFTGRNSEGFLKSVGGGFWGRGCVSIPIKNSEKFEDFLKKWKIEYKKKHVLIPYY